MKTLLAITVAGQLKWLEEAIASLHDPMDVLVIDDSTPGDEIEDFCERKGLTFLTKSEPKGLTDSWNTAYQYLKDLKYDNCILSNDDVRFPKDFSKSFLKGLEEFDLISPLSNGPGTGVCQQVRRYIDTEPTEKNVDKVQVILSERYRKAPYRASYFVNGFCLAFSHSIAKYAYNERYLFNPANINTYNEYDLTNRMNKKGGKIAICKSSYIFHWKDKTFENYSKDWGQPGDYREQLWKPEDNKEIKIKDVPLSDYVDRLKDDKYFSFVRYGDGEWKAIMEGSGEVACRLQTINSRIQSDMIRSLTEHAAEQGVIFGMQSRGLRIFGRDILRFLQSYNIELKWVEADVFHYASRDGLLYPLIKQLREMKMVIVGPSILRGLLDNVFPDAKFIEVSEKNCYKEQEAIKSSILQAHNESKENTVYSFCCGPLAETLILDLHLQMPNNFLIDFGSLWDVFCGVRSRKYTNSEKYSGEILRKNMGIKTVVNIPGWLGRNEIKILQEYAIAQQKESGTDLLEIGSWKGCSSTVIASALSGDRRLWMVDHFRGSSEHQEGEKFYTVPKYTRRAGLWIYPEILENIIKCNFQNKVIILPLSSEKAARVIDEQFSFIFIDGDHKYESVSKDCELWLPHLEKNGVIIFHDYKNSSVHKFCDELKQNKDLSVDIKLQNMIVFRKGE